MPFKSYLLLPLILVTILLFLQYRLWFDTGGMMDMMHLKKQLAQQNEENAKLKQRNDDLLRQIRSLQSNDAAVESRARQELGMIKKGETFYQITK